MVLLTLSTLAIFGLLIWVLTTLLLPHWLEKNEPQELNLNKSVEQKTVESVDSQISARSLPNSQVENRNDQNTDLQEVNDRNTYRNNNPSSNSSEIQNKQQSTESNPTNQPEISQNLPDGATNPEPTTENTNNAELESTQNPTEKRGSSDEFKSAYDI